MKKSLPYFLIIIILLSAGYFVAAKYKKTSQTPKGDKPSFVPQEQNPAPAALTSYTHPDLGFTFSLSKNFSVGTFPEGEGEIVLVKSIGDGTSEAQIYITEFDEPGPLTKKRILKDQPDLGLQNAVEVSVGGEPAVAFESSQADGQKTREVWFVHAGHLYQISAKIENQQLASDMLSNWNW